MMVFDEIEEEQNDVEEEIDLSFLNFEQAFEGVEELPNVDQDTQIQEEIAEDPLNTTVYN